MNQTAYDEDLGTDLSSVSVDTHFDPIPAGQYRMQALQVAIRDSRSGGRMAAVQFDILEPGYEGRKVFENFNFMNANAETVQIALRAIKQWVIACGGTGEERLTLGLLQSLEGREFVGDIRIEKDKSGQYGDKNRIRRFLPAEGAPAARPAPAAPAVARQAAPQRAPAPAGAAAAPRAGKQPWER